MAFGIPFTAPPRGAAGSPLFMPRLMPGDGGLPTTSVLVGIDPSKARQSGNPEYSGDTIEGGPGAAMSGGDLRQGRGFGGGSVSVSGGGGGGGGGAGRTFVPNYLGGLYGGNAGNLPPGYGRQFGDPTRTPMVSSRMGPTPGQQGSWLGPRSTYPYPRNFADTAANFWNMRDAPTYLGPDAWGQYDAGAIPDAPADGSGDRNWGNYFYDDALPGQRGYTMPSYQADNPWLAAAAWQPGPGFDAAPWNDNGAAQGPAFDGRFPTIAPDAAARSWDDVPTSFDAPAGRGIGSDYAASGGAGPGGDPYTPPGWVPYTPGWGRPGFYYADFGSGFQDQNPGWSFYDPTPPPPSYVDLVTTGALPPYSAPSTIPTYVAPTPAPVTLPDPIPPYSAPSTDQTYTPPTPVPTYAPDPAPTTYTAPSPPSYYAPDPAPPYTAPDPAPYATPPVIPAYTPPDPAPAYTPDLGGSSSWYAPAPFAYTPTPYSGLDMSNAGVQSYDTHGPGASNMLPDVVVTPDSSPMLQADIFPDGYGGYGLSWGAQAGIYRPHDPSPYDGQMRANMQQSQQRTSQQLTTAQGQINNNVANLNNPFPTQSSNLGGIAPTGLNSSNNLITPWSLK